MINKISKMLVIDRNLRLITIICGALTAFIGGLVFAGYIFGEYNFFSLGRNYYPMADESAVSFIILGLALAVAIKSRNNRKLHYFVIISAMVISFVAFLSLIDFVTDYAYNLGNLLIPEHEMLGAIPIGRMSYITALCFIFACTALLLLKGKTAKLSVVFSSVNLVIGYIIIFGYSSDVPFLYGGTQIPVALPAAIAIIISAIGLLASAGKNTFPQKYFIGTSTQAILMRKLIPAFVILIVVHNLFTTYTTGNYNSGNAFNESLNDIILLIATGIVIWLLSRSIGKSVDKNITDRIVAEQELQRSLKILTDKSAELDVKNKEWIYSRIATFNIMEDLIEAKNMLENVNKNLSDEISERKLADEALIESEIKFRSYIENAPDGIYILDETGQLIETNKAAFDILGYTMDEILNFNIRDLLAEESFYDGMAHFKKLNETGKATAELLHKHKDGSTRWLEINAVKLSQTRVLGFLKDVTERKQAEELLKYAHDNLEIKVQERTAELAQANNLLQIESDNRQKVIEKEKELNAMKSQFISTVSHEFRTPLAGILSSAQLLKLYYDKWDNEKREKVFTQIFDSVKHNIRLLDDVSLINKGGSNTITVNPSMIDLRELLQSIIEENIQVYGHGFEIVTAFQLAKSRYFFDKEIIRHIFGNILSNAIKYSAKLKIINFNVTEEKDKILFIVIDFGIGIPLIDQKYLFETFHRASNVGAISGTGFGLSIVKRLVDILDGTIEIISEIGKGTTVSIELPIVKAPVKEK